MIDYSLYLCTDSGINRNYDIQECVRQAIHGGVTIVQVREKNKTTEEMYLIANKIKKVTDAYSIPLIINDNVDVALKINADGVHIGQDDIVVAEAPPDGRGKLHEVFVILKADGEEQLLGIATLKRVAQLFTEQDTALHVRVHVA